MKLDTSDCPNPATDPEGYREWERREMRKWPAPDPKTDWEAFEQHVTEFTSQMPYRLVPKWRVEEIEKELRMAKTLMECVEAMVEIHKEDWLS